MLRMLPGPQPKDPVVSIMGAISIDSAASDRIVESLLVPKTQGIRSLDDPKPLPLGLVLGRSLLLDAPAMPDAANLPILLIRDVIMGNEDGLLGQAPAHLFSGEFRASYRDLVDVVALENSWLSACAYSDSVSRESDYAPNLDHASMPDNGAPGASWIYADGSRFAIPLSSSGTDDPTGLDHSADSLGGTVEVYALDWTRQPFIVGMPDLNPLEPESRLALLDNAGAAGVATFQISRDESIQGCVPGEKEGYARWTRSVVGLDAALLHTNREWASSDGEAPGRSGDGLRRSPEAKFHDPREGTTGVEAHAQPLIPTEFQGLSRSAVPEGREHNTNITTPKYLPGQASLISVWTGALAGIVFTLLLKVPHSRRSSDGVRRSCTLGNDN